MSDEPIIIQSEEPMPDKYDYPDVIKPVVYELSTYAKRHSLDLRMHVHKCDDAKALAGNRIMCFDLHWNNAVYDCSFQLSDDDHNMALKAAECREKMYVAHAKLQLNLWGVGITDAIRDGIRDQVGKNKAHATKDKESYEFKASFSHLLPDAIVPALRKLNDHQKQNDDVRFYADFQIKDGSPHIRLSMHAEKDWYDCHIKTNDDNQTMSTMAELACNRLIAAYYKLKMGTSIESMAEGGIAIVKRGNPIDLVAELSEWLKSRRCTLGRITHERGRTPNIEVFIPPEACDCKGNPNAKHCQHNVGFLGVTIIDALRCVIQPTEIMGNYYKHMESF